MKTILSTVPHSMLPNYFLEKVFLNTYLTESYSICYRRYKSEYSTSIPTHKGHMDHDGIKYIFDSQWPNVKDPTAKEIFGLTSTHQHMEEVENKRLIRQRYHKYCKLYHPDISKKIRIIKSSSEPTSYLTDEEKVYRFKLVTQANYILKNPSKGNLYEQNWKEGFSHDMSPSYTRYYEQQMNANPNYWNAGTWEEIHHSKTNNKNDQFNDFKMLSVILSGLVICIAGSNYLTNIEDSINGNVEYESLNFDQHPGDD